MSRTANVWVKEFLGLWNVNQLAIVIKVTPILIVIKVTQYSKHENRNIVNFSYLEKSTVEEIMDNITIILYRESHSLL